MRYEFKIDENEEWRGLRVKNFSINTAIMEEVRSVFTILIGKPTRKRPLGRPTCRHDENIRMDYKEMINRDIVTLEAKSLDRRKRTKAKAFARMLYLINTANCVDSVSGRDYWGAYVITILKHRIP